MKVICNGAEREVTPGAKIIDLVQELDMNPQIIVVECNGKILNYEDFDKQNLEEGMVVELIRFVGGGCR